jgi:hypothetical protein
MALFVTIVLDTSGPFFLVRMIIVCGTIMLAVVLK